MDDHKALSDHDVQNNGLYQIRQSAAGLAFIHRHLIVSLPWYMLIPVALGITFRDAEYWSGILLWSFVFYLIVIPRYFASLRYSRKELPDSSQELLQWRQWLVAPSVLSGILWGFSPVVFFELGDTYQQLVLLTIINGVCLMAILLSTFCLPAFIAFLVPAMSGEFFYFAFFAESHYRVVALLPLILLPVLLQIARNLRTQTKQSEKLKVENRQLVDKLIREKDRAEAANRAKSQFLAAANHDLRQPVHSLSLLAEALKNDIKDPETRDLVSYMSDSVESLDFVLTELLDISRLEAKVVTVRKMPVRLEPLVRAIFEELKPLAVEKNIKLRLRVTDSLVYSDPIHLSKILRSLTTNAIQYTMRGGVLIAVRHRGEHVVLQVWDTGEGVTDKELDNIFTEFFQCHNKERASGKGLGLGLSISRRLAELLDHRLSVRSVLGKGSVFEIQLPWLDDENVVSSVNTTPAVSLFPLEGCRVLVVDNESSILKSTEAVLNRWKCVVDIADSFESAIDRLQRGRSYDIYLLDYSLGSGGNGIELLKRLNSLDGRSVPGIIMTGNTQPEFIQASTEAGYTLLHKPVKPAALRGLIMKLAGERSSSMTADKKMVN